jgi:hypothetical protein
MGMYLRITERRNRDGSTVAYYALAENIWNASAKRSETRVVHSFGRADQLDRAALQRLVASINRVIDADAADALPTHGKTVVPEIDIDAVFELGVVLAARGLWQELGIGEAIRTRMVRAGLSAPHETALFAMAAQRLDDPASKLACATRWLPDIAWLPEAGGLAVDQLYRALDFLAVWWDEIERDVVLRAVDLLRLDVRRMNSWPPRRPSSEAAGLAFLILDADRFVVEAEDPGVGWGRRERRSGRVTTS